MKLYKFVKNKKYHKKSYNQWNRLKTLSYSILGILHLYKRVRINRFKPS